MDAEGWWSLQWGDWADLGLIRARLAAGADPNARLEDHPPLHLAAERGSAEVVAELASRVDDVDAEDDGRTALWVAVYARRPGIARVLAAAGADPWRPMMAGWSPGRLSLAGPMPDLFGAAPDGTELPAAEAAAAAEAPRLLTASGGDDLQYEGTGLACVAGISGAEAARRLEATPAPRPWRSFCPICTCITPWPAHALTPACG
jgi:Ankyrin repeats (3 copies)